MDTGHVYPPSTAPSSRKNNRRSHVSSGFYDEFNVLGSVSSPEEQLRHRERQGYCTTCRQNPIKLFEIKKSKLNPLRRTKEPLTVAGQSLNGQCLICNPHLDPSRRSSTISSSRTGLNSSIRSRDSANGGGHSPVPSPGSRRHVRPSTVPERGSPGPPVLEASCVLAAADISPRPRKTTPRSVSMNAADISPRPRTAAHRASSMDATCYSSPVPPLESNNGSFRSRDDRPTPQRTHSGRSAASNRSAASGRSAASNRSAASASSSEIPPEDIVMPTEHGMSSSSGLDFNSSSGLGFNSSSGLDFNQSHASLRDNSSFQESHSSVASNRQGSERSRPLTVSPPQSQDAPTRPGAVAVPGIDATPLPEPSGIDSVPFHREISQPGSSFSGSPNDEDEAQVMELKVLLKDLGGNVECTVDVLADVSRSHPKSELIQVFFLETLCDMCKKNDDTKEFLMSMGIQDDVLNVMEQNPGSVAVQEVGCGAVWTLGVNERNRKGLGKAGAGECVSNALKNNIANEGVARKAISALRTLSPESDIQIELAQYHCAQKVAEAMMIHPSVVDIQRDGCAFLSNASIDMKTKTVSAVSYEEMKAVVNAMENHIGNPKVTSSVCFALKNYTYEEENLRTMRRFRNLREMLTNVEGESRQEALEVLESIELSQRLDSSLEEIIYNSIGDTMNSPDAVSDLTGILKEYHWSPRLTSGGLETLVKLAHGSHANCRKIAESDALAEIVKSMHRHEQNAGVQQHGCQVLTCLCASQQGRIAVCSTPACDAILNAMRECQRDEGVQVAALCALKAMAPDVEFSSQQQENEMMAALQEALQRFPDNSELQAVGAEVVTAFSSRWT